MALTPKRLRFIEEYPIDLNATAAAKRAGFSARTAYSAGVRLLRNVDIVKAILARRAEAAQKAGVTAEMVRAELAKMAFSNMLNYTRVQPDGTLAFDLSKLTHDQAAAIVEVTIDEYTDHSWSAEGSKEGDAGGDEDHGRPVKRVKIKLANKETCLHKLGLDLGMFREGLDVKHEGHVALQNMMQKRYLFEDPPPAPPLQSAAAKPQPKDAG